MNIKRSYINDQPPIQSVQMVCSKILIADIKWSWTAFDGLICFRINVFFKRNQKSNIILYYVTYKCYNMARERVLDMDLNGILWIVVASLLHMYSASVSFSLSLSISHPFNVRVIRMWCFSAITVIMPINILYGVTGVKII